MKPLNLGVIGCGVIGGVHLGVANKSPLVNVVAVADSIEERARKYGEEFGVAKAYGSAEALLEDPEVEGVVLAFPTARRAEVALKAFAHGKHVLIEKPAAMNAGEIQRMMAARGDLVCASCSSR